MYFRTVAPCVCKKAFHGRIRKEENLRGFHGRLLEKDITKFLTAILICTTTATIYSAALVTDMAAQYGGEKMVT